MKRVWAVSFTCLILVQLLLAQASNKQSSSPPASAKKTDSYCASTPDFVNGEIVYTDCNGNKKRESVAAGQSSSAADGKAEQSQSSPSSDPATEAMRLQAEQADYSYHVFAKVHAQRTFTFQYWTGEIIFFVVLIIVFAGLVFSAVQFYVGIRHPLESRTADGTVSKTDEASVSEFEASLQGIKLKSSVLGLLILAMSMVFFYLYLKYVYPISSVSK
jgi:hypothetical protein